MTAQTLTQKYAAERAETVVPRMLAAIDKVHHNTTWIARGALAVTTPHQILFLGSLGHGHGAFEIVTAWVFAILIPAITDLGMLTMLRITQTAGMARTARRRALGVLLVLVAESAAVNFIAPGAMIFRVLVAFAAVVLALVEWTAAAVEPDFSEMEATEAEVTMFTVATDPADDARKAQRRERERERRAARKAEAQRLADEANAKREVDRMARRLRAAERKTFAAGDAPVSPAPLPTTYM